MGLFMSQMLPDVLEYYIEAPVKISLKTFLICLLKTKHLDVQGPGGSGSSGVAGPGKNGEKREMFVVR